MTNPDTPGNRPGSESRLPIDLRSDTVTKPTPGMRQAMAEAEVGDDVFGEDPTVNRLQTRAAELLGKEAALFVPSGTMANQVGVRTHVQPGDEVVMERTSHAFAYESAAIAALSGAQVNLLDGDRGVLTAGQIEPVIDPGVDAHHAPTRLLSLENTHNRGGGRVYPLVEIEAIAVLARRHGLAMHLDGARLLNACVASGLTAVDYTRHFDSCTLCFSKGLGAPVGSVLAGPAAFIKRAHRFRKMFGGGMRQAGVMAAAGIYALEHHVERLAEDHRNARRLAERLAQARGARVDVAAVETNIVYLRLDPAASRTDARGLVDSMQQRGVLALALAPMAVRLVTHLDVTREQVERAAEVICGVLA